MNVSSHKAVVGHRCAALGGGRDNKWMSLVCSILGIGLAIGGAGAIATGITELGFILLSFAVMAWFGWWVVRKKLYKAAFLVVMFLGGYAISWGIGFLGYRYLLLDDAVALGLPTNHTKTTAVLVLLGSCATVAGGLFALSFFLPSPRKRPPSIHRDAIIKVLPFFAICYFVFQSMSLQVLGLNARWEIGNYHQIGSASYLIAGFQIIAYPFYALLGMSLESRLKSVWNLAGATIMITIIGIQSLTGGRSAALEPLVVFLFGATFSCVPWRRVALLFAAAFPMAIFLMVKIGQARGIDGFNDGAFGGKVNAIIKVVMEGRNDENQYDKTLFVLFSRLFETSGQVVIDNVVDKKQRLGFVNFERLLFVFVPQFVCPGKKSLDDSNERLAADYGYAVNEYSSAPLTLLADSYERFGVLGVALFHLLVGAFLGAVGALVCQARQQVLSLIVLVCCGRTVLLLYQVSILGSFHLLFYGFIKDIFIISLLYYSGNLVNKFLKSSRHSLWLK